MEVEKQIKILNKFKEKLKNEKSYAIIDGLYDSWIKYNSGFDIEESRISLLYEEIENLFINKYSEELESFSSMENKFDCSNINENSENKELFYQIIENNLTYYTKNIDKNINNADMHKFLNWLSNMSKCTDLSIFKKQINFILNKLNIVTYKFDFGKQPNMLSGNLFTNTVRECSLLEKKDCDNECEWKFSIFGSKCVNKDYKKILFNSYCSKESYKSKEEIMLMIKSLYTNDLNINNPKKISKILSNKIKIDGKFVDLKSKTKEELCDYFNQILENTIIEKKLDTIEGQVDLWEKINMSKNDVHQLQIYIRYLKKKSLSAIEILKKVSNWLYNNKKFLVTIISISLLAYISIYMYNSTYINENVNNFNPNNIKLPEGSVTNPDGSIIYPNGVVIDPSGSVNTPDNSTINEDGSIIYKNGVIVNANGSVKIPENTLVDSDLTVFYRNGVTIDAKGSMKIPKNSIYKDGSIIYPNGVVVDTNGSIKYKDTLLDERNVLDSEGYLLTKDRILISPSGKETKITGPVILEDGSVSLENGLRLKINEKLMQPDGTFLKWNGKFLERDTEIPILNNEGTVTENCIEKIYPEDINIKKYPHKYEYIYNLNMKGDLIEYYIVDKKTGSIISTVSSNDVQKVPYPGESSVKMEYPIEKYLNEAVLKSFKKITNDVKIEKDAINPLNYFVKNNESVSVDILSGPEKKITKNNVERINNIYNLSKFIEKIPEKIPEEVVKNEEGYFSKYEIVKLINKYFGNFISNILQNNKSEISKKYENKLIENSFNNYKGIFFKNDKPVGEHFPIDNFDLKRITEIENMEYEKIETDTLFPDDINLYFNINTESEFIKLLKGSIEIVKKYLTGNYNELLSTEFDIINSGDKYYCVNNLEECLALKLLGQNYVINGNVYKFNNEKDFSNILYASEISFA